MKILTKIFGEIEVNEEKVLNFKEGIIGFPDLNKFMLIHDADDEKKTVSWLQSIDEPAFAMPVVDPLAVDPTYNPIVEDELLKPLGDLVEEDIIVLVTMTVPADVKKATVNLKAPIVVNSKNLNACQIILDDDKYLVKHPINSEE
ncbi:MAG: flagellar assembly protein FliW [Lachnospiraceae bacterium]|nr:flagellar assembly protein FliW [Lachnospiraceae bacterium]